MLLFTYVALSILLIESIYTVFHGILQHYGQMSFRSFQFLNSSGFTKGWVLVTSDGAKIRIFALSTNISCGNGNIIQRRISTLEDHPSHPFLSPPVIILYAHTQLMGSVEPDEQYERFLMIDRSSVAGPLASSILQPKAPSLPPSLPPIQ